MIERIIVAVLTHLGSWLMTKGLEAINKKQAQAADESNVDQKLANLKSSYLEASDGKPLTPEQKKKFNSALREFIRSSNSGGGL